jgi:transposase
MEEKEAYLWMEKMIQVQAGNLTASEAASQLGVSRKTFYKHQGELLSVMLDKLTGLKNGRPQEEPDKKKEILLNRVDELEKQVDTLQCRLRIRQVIHDTAGMEKKRAGDRNHE